MRPKRPSEIPRPHSATKEGLSSASLAADAVKRVVAADAVAIYVESDNPDALLLYASVGWSPPENTSSVQFRPLEGESRPSSPVIRAFSKRPDLPEFAAISAEATAFGILDVPIDRGLARGVVRCVRSRAFDHGDAEKLSQAAVWLQALLESWQNESNLAAASTQLAMAESEEALIRQTVLEACKLVHAEPDRSGIYLSKRADGSTGYVLHSAKHAPLERHYEASVSSPTIKVLVTGQLLWSAHIKRSLETQPEWADVGITADAEDHPTNAFIGVPLRLRDQTGALILKARLPRAWGIFEVRLVERLATTFLAHLDRMRVRDSLLFSLFNASERPMAAVDLKGRVLAANFAASLVVGKTVEELQQSTVDVAFYGGSKSLARHVTEALSARGDEPLRGHYTYLTRDATDGLGIPIPVRLEAKELAVPHGRTIGSAGIFDPLLAHPLPSQVRSFGDFEHFTFTADSDMIDVLEEADESRDRSLLLVGERGSGKSFVARHLRTSERDPFVEVRCGGMPATELARELGFGVAKGRVDDADNGVLFIDELASVPLMVQRQLLNVLEDRAIGTRPVSLRLIAATRCRLNELPDATRFLPDLLNRLDAGSALEIPPFRDRRSDILLAAIGYLQYSQNEATHRATGFESEAVEALWRYKWPGGVRELFDQLAAASLRWQQDIAELKDADKLRRTLIGSDHLWKHLVEDALRNPYPGSRLPSLDEEATQKHLETRAERRAKRVERRPEKEQDVPEAASALLRNNPHLVAMARREGNAAVADILQRSMECSRSWALTVIGRALPRERTAERPSAPPDRRKSRPPRR